MQTVILKGNSPDNICQAARLIHEGEIVAFPTETVYGLGADATNEQAIKKVFIAKGRPASDPLIVHISDVKMLKGIVKEVPEVARLLMEKFWPGPLTLIFKKTDRIPGSVTAGLSTVAVRMPDNAVALNLIAESGVPLAAPSANMFGRPSPTQVSHVLDDLGGKIKMILNGGPTEVGVESTVLDITCSPPVILRPGGISRESLESIVGAVEISRGKDKGLPISPGLMKQHYAPKARLLLFEGRNRDKLLASMKAKVRELTRIGKVGVLVPEEVRADFKGLDIEIENLGSFNDLERVARSLFSRIRNLDNRGVDYILTLAPPREGIGLAIYDRLYKAAGSRTIEVD